LNSLAVKASDYIKHTRVHRTMYGQTWCRKPREFGSLMHLRLNMGKGVEFQRHTVKVHSQ